MPVTKTAKRALRSSEKKAKVNQLFNTRLEVALRKARKTKGKKEALLAFSLIDRAGKKKIIHKNKASRMKKALSRLLSENKRPKSALKKTSN